MLETLKYYREVHNRHGLDGMGTGLSSYITCELLGRLSRCFLLKPAPAEARLGARHDKR